MNEEKNKSGYHFKPKETKDAKPAEKEQIKHEKETSTAQKSSAKTKQKKVKKSKKTGRQLQSSFCFWVWELQEIGTMKIPICQRR